MDWIVVRNKQRIVQGLSDLAARLGFRSADALAERVIYREFFPRGLTALDNLDEKTLGTRPSLSHLTARQELMSLMQTLKLPLDERGQQRAAAHAQWLLARDQPLEFDDVIAE
jgi:chromosome partitioning protein